MIEQKIKNNKYEKKKKLWKKKEFSQNSIAATSNMKKNRNKK